MESLHFSTALLVGRRNFEKSRRGPIENREVPTVHSLGYMFTVNSGLVNLGPLRTPLLAQVKMSSSYDERVWLLYFQSE